MANTSAATDSRNRLKSVSAGIFFLVTEDRNAWGNEISRFDGPGSLVTTRRRAFQEAGNWRAQGANFTIFEVPGLVLELGHGRIGMVDFQARDPFGGWDATGSIILRVGTPIDAVIEAFGQFGNWEPAQNPAPYSIVHRRIDEMAEPAPVTPGRSFTTFVSSIPSSRQPINWTHQRGKYSASGTLRVVSEFMRVNSPAVAPLTWDVEGLRGLGFDGFVPFAGLGSVDVPSGSGVYAILRAADNREPRFLAESSAGWFKAKDPALPLQSLQENWVPGADVIYIGKADGGVRRTRGLKKRLDEFRRHGAGEPIGHWGGRMIWQLADRDNLLVCWLPCESAEDLETQLLRAFEDEFKRLPFANLKRGRD